MLAKFNVIMAGEKGLAAVAVISFRIDGAWDTRHEAGLLAHWHVY